MVLTKLLQSRQRQERDVTLAIFQAPGREQVDEDLDNSKAILIHLRNYTSYANTNDR